MVNQICIGGLLQVCLRACICPMRRTAGHAAMQVIRHGAAQFGSLNRQSMLAGEFANGFAG
jgi:hypothetical protein